MVAPLCVLGMVIQNTTEVYSTSPTELPAPPSRTATQSERLHIRYNVVAWSVSPAYSESNTTNSHLTFTQHPTPFKSET
jgi:hypothetical protein